MIKINIKNQTGQILREYTNQQAQTFLCCVRNTDLLNLELINGRERFWEQIFRERAAVPARRREIVQYMCPCILSRPKTSAL
jgi:hypothetical protein